MMNEWAWTRQKGILFLKMQEFFGKDFHGVPEERAKEIMVHVCATLNAMRIPYYDKSKEEALVMAEATLMQAALVRERLTGVPTGSFMRTEPCKKEDAFKQAEGEG